MIFTDVYLMDFGRVQVNFGQKPFAFDLEARCDFPSCTYFMFMCGVGFNLVVYFLSFYA